MLPIKFRYIWPNSFRGEESKKSANQKQESPVAAIFVNVSGLKIFSSETAWPNDRKHDRKHLWKVLY
jgi:hypothetical protein